jgi:hypothetical protein
VATDVAAEGLDLRRAERVVHYDLPWTPMRLEQREGRAVRLGSAHARIEVIRFPPPPALEAALRLGERLERKAALPGLAGLGPDGTRLWRWRSALADRLGDAPGAAGTALVRGTGGRGVLAGFTLWVRRGDSAESLAAVVGWVDPEDGWTEDAHIVGDRLLRAAHADTPDRVSADDIQGALDRLAGPIRSRLALGAGRRWAAAEPTCSARRVTERLGRAVAEAARRRDRRELERLDRAVRFVAGGHTAGEALLMDRMADAPERDLLAWIARMPAPAPRGDPIEARLTGIIVFEA